MKRFVVVFAIITGILSIIVALVNLIVSVTAAALLGGALAVTIIAFILSLLEGVFMIGLGLYLKNLDERCDEVKKDVFHVRQWVTKSAPILNNEIKKLYGQIDTMRGTGAVGSDGEGQLIGQEIAALRAEMEELEQQIAALRERQILLSDAALKTMVGHAPAKTKKSTPKKET